ncbi:MAG: methylenetetrahydrofolate reductase [Solobacterium sp.]|nr:methylenetetrahydrofolate reductase [Solobacterium sp.]
MNIPEILASGRITLSFEVFPPKKADGFVAVKEACEKIAGLHPDFMSVTCGAGGTTVGYTLELARRLTEDTLTPVLPHLTSVAFSEEEALKFLHYCESFGIGTIMALRGDIPEGGRKKNDFEHAEDLIRFIKANSSLAIGAACYPEGHPESRNKKDDIRYLKQKVDAGVDFLTTQMFFNNNIFYNFLYRAREAGIQVPILAGIMPITNAIQLKRSVALSGTNVPERFRAIVDCFGSDENAMKQAGIIYASEQIIDLIANGVRHIHVYSMNKPDVAEGILNNLRDILK